MYKYINISSHSFTRLQTKCQTLDHIERLHLQSYHIRIRQLKQQKCPRKWSKQCSQISVRSSRHSIPAGVWASCGSGTFYSNCLSTQCLTCAAISSSVPHGCVNQTHPSCLLDTLTSCKVFKNTDSGQIWTIISNQRSGGRDKIVW